MRRALPCFLVGVSLFVGAACVGEDPTLTNNETNDGAAPGPEASTAGDGAPLTDGGGSDGQPLGDGVEGTVVDLGTTPVANATVRIGTVSVQTDAIGQFKIPNVKLPFEVDVVSPLDPTADGTTKYVMSVRGLKTRTPILHVRFIGAERTAPASGTTDLTFTGNNNRLRIAFVPQVGLPTATTSPGVRPVNPETYSETVTWQGKPTIAGFWYFLHWVEPTATPGLPASFSGVARIAGSLTDTVAATVSPMSALGVGQDTLAGTVTYPADATEKTVSVGVKLSPADRVGYTFVTYRTAPGNTSLSAPVPGRAGITALVVGTARSPNAAGAARQTQVVVWKTNLNTRTSNVAIAFPSAPSLTTPAEGANVKATDTFSWTGGTAPYRLDVDCIGYKASIVTMATDAALPTGLGSWPAAATACTAAVTSYGSNVPSLESFVAADAPFKTTSPWAADGTMATMTNAFMSAQ